MKQSLLLSAALIVSLVTAAYAGHGKGWYEPQGKELRLVCYSTATGQRCANVWVGNAEGRKK